MAYLLDANCFIQAKNSYYPFDFCPGFWEWLQAKNTLGILFSINHVRDELLVGDDTLADWVKQRPSGFFLPANDSTERVSQIYDWVQNHFSNGPSKDKFFQGADAWLIAYALDHGHTVVTLEKHDDKTKKIKVPNICKEFGVPCINTFELLREVGIELNISRQPCLRFE